MRLLDPGSAVLAAAVTVPALLLLYFLRLRRKPLRISSTLLWERAVHDLQVNVPFARIRPSWLLFLQLLAVACLILAAGRPAIDGGAAPATVLVIDRSASMAVRDPAAPGAEPRLARAVDEARELLPTLLLRSGSGLESLLQRLGLGIGEGAGGEGGAGGGSRVMLASLAGEARAETPFTADAGVIADALGRLQPADQPARIDALLDLLRAALAESAGSEGETGRQPLRVLLVSASPWPADVPIPPGVDLQMVPVEEPRPLSNAGIVGLGARRDEQDLGTVRVFGRLRSPGTAARPVSVELRLAPAGTLADRPNLPEGAFLATPSGIQTVTLSPVPGAVPPVLEGTVAFTLGGLSPAGGEVLKLALLEPDALMADNAAMVLLPRAEPPRILMVAPGPDGRDADPLLLAILRDIADPSGLRPDAVRTTSAEGYTQWAGRPGLIALQPADLVVFDRVSAETPSPAPTLSFAAAPRESGLTFTPAGEGAPTDNLRFVSWLRSHPVMRYAGLDAVFVRKPGRLTWADQADTVGGGPSRVTVLAESPLGAAIAMAEPAGGQPLGGQAPGGTSASGTLGPRHIAVAFRPGDSNWPADVSFPVFMLSAVEYLTARATALEGRAATTVSPATLPLPVRTDPAGNPLTIDLFRLAEAGEPVRAVSATPPALAGVPQDAPAAGGASPPTATASAAPSTPASRAARATVSFGVLEKAGLYVARLPGDQTGAEPGDTLLPVNLLRESATELRLESNSVQRPLGMAAGGGAPALVRPRELWPVLLLIAVLLLTVEWLVFAARMRSL